MSGSYRRPPGAAGEPPQQNDPYEAFDPYGPEPATGPTAGASTGSLTSLTGLRVDTRTEAALYAPSRGGVIEKPKGTSPIVPAGSVTNRALTMVVTIMCFLACLTAGAVYMMNQSASAWMRDIASEVTVQVEPRERIDTERTVKDVSAFLVQQPGIANVRPLDLESAANLLEPWLGNLDALKALPVPRLIAVEVDRDKPADLDAVGAALKKQFPGVVLDDHRQWQQQIRTLTRSFALGGIAILALVGAATTAIIITATRSSIAANREIVEVLHFVGATDRFIAREFEKQFLTLGVRAGLVGALLAMAVFVAMPTVMELLGRGTASLNEFNRLIGSGSLDPAGFALLALVVVVVAALCMLTSRISVFRILHSK
jgi:cell division transport system permease protein